MIPLGFSGSAQLSAMVESLTSPTDTLRGFPGTEREIECDKQWYLQNK